MQVACFKWPKAYSVDLCASLGVNHVDDMSLTEEVLLEPTSLALSFCNSQVSPQTPSTGTVKRADAHSLPLNVKEDLLSLPRPPPSVQGRAVLIRLAASQSIDNCLHTGNACPVLARSPIPFSSFIYPYSPCPFMSTVCLHYGLPALTRCWGVQVWGGPTAHPHQPAFCGCPAPLCSCGHRMHQEIPSRP